MDNKIIAATLKVDADAAQKNVLKLKGTVEDLRKEFKKAEAGSEEQLAALKKLQAAEQDLTKAQKELSEATNTSFKSFKQQLKEANQELLTMSDRFGEGSEQAINAAKRVAELKDAIGDSKALVDAFNPDRKFQAFSSALSGVAGGFSAVTGAMALVGVEGEAVEKSLVKVQAALALSQGVNSVLELKDTFKQLGTFIQATTIYQKANNAATAAAAVIQKLFAGAVDTTSTSFKVLKGAIVATGIGALVVLLGFVIEKINSMSSATEDAAKAQERLKEQVEGLNAALQDQIGFSDRATKEAIAAAKARGASETELTNIERKGIEDRIYLRGLNVQDIKAKGADAFKAEKELQAEQQNLRIFDLEQQAKTRQKADEEAKKAREKALAEEKARREKLIQERETNEQQALAQIRKLQLDNDLALIQDEQERNKQRIMREAEFERERIANLNLSAQTRLELLRQINANEAIELEKIIQDNKAKEAQQDKDRLQAGLDRNIAALKRFAEEKKKDAEEQKAIDQTVFDNKVAIADATEGLLSNLSELFGKQTAAGKIAALAQIAINTAVGFVQGLRIAQQSAAAAGPGAAFVFPVFYATQISAVLAAASKAKSVLAAGNSGSGSSTSTTSQAQPTLPQAPLTPAPQTVNTTIDQNSVNAIGNAAAGGVNSIRAYVVEQDSAEAAARAARLQGASILGG